MEEEVAELLQDRKTHKPIVGYIAGVGAPQGRTHGHAGAVWEDDVLGAASKIKAWERVGIQMVPTPGDLGAAMVKAMQ